MPEIAAAQTAADMTYAKPHAFMPTGGSNRRAARMQAAALRWLVRMAALLTAAVLVFLIGYILVMGIPNLKPELFAWEYNSENVSLTPALINTVLMTAFSLAISTPLGIFAAIWLVEYAHRGSKLVKVVRVTTETLQGIPSIVYGLFGMLFFVTKLHWGYSMIAGAFTLAIMVLPVIMRTTEEALIAVPDSYREGSFGLGAGKLRTVFTIVLPSAMPGILSGVILATGRIVGETAALIYTASSVAKIPSGVFSSTRTLAVHMYLLSNEGLYIGQTYGTAVVLLVLVLVINGLSEPGSWQNGKGQCPGSGIPYPPVVLVRVINDSRSRAGSREAGGLDWGKTAQQPPSPAPRVPGPYRYRGAAFRVDEEHRPLHRRGGFHIRPWEYAAAQTPRRGQDRLAAHNERRQPAKLARSCGCLPRRGKHCSLPGFATLNRGPTLTTPHLPTIRRSRVPCRERS